jgi:aconitate hydratase
LKGKDVFLRDIWPSRQEVEELAKKVVCPEIYEENYKNILNFNKKWNDLEIYENEVFNWPESNYICKAPYFQGMTKDLPKIGDIQYYLLLQ